MSLNNKVFDDYDVQTVEVMKRVLSSDSNCLDVGCHTGKVLRHMLQFAPNGTHFAFEPLPDCFSLLVRKFGSLPNVHLKRTAVSDFSGKHEFQYVVSNPSYSGLRKRRYDRPLETIRPIEVEVSRIDDSVPRACVVRFIKIDVEGGELGVMRGGLETIARHRPFIVFEHGLGGADCYGTTPDDIYALLVHEAGLKITLLRNWLLAAWSARHCRGSFSLEQFSDEFWEHHNFYFLAFP